MEQFSEEWIGAPDSELPAELLNRFGKFKPCDGCGEAKIALSGDELNPAYVCYECGTQYQMHEVEESGFMSSLLSPSDGNDGRFGKSKEEAAKDGTRNFGKSLQMIGLLCCLTIVGAIVGIPLLIIGAHLKNKHD